MVPEKLPPSRQWKADAGASSLSKIQKAPNGEIIPPGGLELVPFRKFLFTRYSGRLKVRS